MTGDRIARISLRIDAVYCVVLGVLVAAAAPLASGPLALPALLLTAVGVGTTAWGVFVWIASHATPLRRRTLLVMAANIVASLGLAATGILAGTALLSIAALVLAADVAAFAVSQGVAVRRMARPAV